MKVYISGKITGDPDYKAKFGKAASELRAAGHTPINPARLPEGMSKGDYMRINFAQMDSADAIMFLPDWQDSDARSWSTLGRCTSQKRFTMQQLNAFLMG